VPIATPPLSLLSLCLSFGFKGLSIMAEVVSVSSS
jgi:hypothetical protein